jgi:high-affinity nickel-transport protein
VLFAAGMVLFDSIDGVLMSRAYSWAFLKPIRKIYYNFTVTVLSVTVALSIGMLLLVQLASEWVPALAWAGRVDLEYAGFGLVALFVLVWAASVAWYHLAGIEDRFEETYEKGLA